MGKKELSHIGYMYKFPVMNAIIMDGKYALITNNKKYTKSFEFLESVL